LLCKDGPATLRGVMALLLIPIFPLLFYTGSRPDFYIWAAGLHSMSALPYWKTASVTDEFGMALPERKYSNGDVNRAGKLLKVPGTPDEVRWAHDVISNWRGCHNYPLNTLRATLNARLKQVESGESAVQRLKRTPSILKKLLRLPTMKLSQMQDIGGLRAVVKNLKEVTRLLQLYDGSGPHKLRPQSSNYIDSPKADGYRSAHLIYEYANARFPQFEGMLIEIQIRTRLQHAWAIAVEVTSTIIGQALKMNQGDDSWKEFFRLASASFSHIEKSPVVAEYSGLSKAEVFARVAESERKLQVLAKLDGLSRAASTMHMLTEGETAFSYLIVLDLGFKSVVVRDFSKDQQDNAIKEYARLEKRAADGEAIDPVLVTGESLANLKKAFANYWLDTQLFVKALTKVIGEATHS